MDRSGLRFKIYLIVFIVLLTIGILGFTLIEDFSLIDSVYFSIVTMATVGYGDVHPQTDLGKFLALIIIIGGVGTFLGIVASITDIFVNRREEENRHQRLNIVIGLFFSEMGSDLLKRLSMLNPDAGQNQAILNVTDEWNSGDFDRAATQLKTASHSLDIDGCNFESLAVFFRNSGDFLLRLLENPNIQEHEMFTDLLRALFHLKDELLNRSDLSKLGKADRAHLENDMLRVYHLLIVEWVYYMKYLQQNYAFLFSLAKRRNPFNPDARVEI